MRVGRGGKGRGLATHFSQGELLPEADPGPAVERDVRPALRRPLVPPFGAVLRCGREVRGRRRVEVLAPLHEYRRVADGGAFEDALVIGSVCGS